MKKFNFIEGVLLVSYCVFVLFLSLALFNSFKPIYIALILAGLVLGLAVFRKSFNISWKRLWPFLAVPPVVLGFGFLRGFFTGDAYYLWLPVAKHIAQTASFPAITAHYIFARMPLLTLLFAGTFSLAGHFNEFLCLWVPLFFTSAEVVLLLQWGREKKLSKYLYFIPLLLLTNIPVAFYGGWDLMQEAPILFFATAFFYYYEKYLQSHQRRDLAFLAVSFVLAAASKISGLFLGLLLIYLFLKAKEKKYVFSYLFCCSIPILLWLARNYIVFDNPIFPILNGFFKGRYYHLVTQRAAYLTLPSPLIGLWEKYAWVIRKFFLVSFPFIFLSLYGFIKKRRFDYLLLVISYFLFKETFLFTPSDSSARYYYVFLGLFIVYALIGLRQARRSVLACLFALAIAGLLAAPLTDSTSAFISIFEDIFAPLKAVFVFLHDFRYGIAALFLVLAWRAARKRTGLILTFLYCFFILQLEFIANKSWLNIWPVIGGVLGLSVIALVKDFKHWDKVFAVVLGGAVLLNSWGLAAVYYWRQGGITLPVPFVWETSRWAAGVMDAHSTPEERSEFRTLTAGQPGYFTYHTDYRAIVLYSYVFWLEFEDYHRDLSGEELYHLLKKNKVKFVVRNISGFNCFLEEQERFFAKVRDYEGFTLIAARDNTYFIWQIH